MFAFNLPVSSCIGERIAPKNPKLNQKQYKMSSSSYLMEKKAFTVINNGNDAAENQNTPDSNKCVTNVGGPGDAIQSLLVFNNKIKENSIGLDKKHGNYDRYLARKRGWNTIQQNCS